MWDYLYYKITEIGQAVRKSKKQHKQGIILLFDGLDSGMSLDLLNRIRKEVLDFIVREDNKKNFEVYILCSANSYEFCNNYNCKDVINQKDYVFTTYDEFKSYFEVGE